METQEKLLPQQAGWIEVFLRQFPQGKRWSGWKAQSNIDALGVEQRNGGAGPRIFLAFEPAPIPFAKPQKKRFDVLAGAQGVDGKVRARAVIFEQSRPAHSYAVGLPAGGFNAIVAIRLAIRPLQNLGDGGARSDLAFGDLPLD